MADEVKPYTREELDALEAAMFPDPKVDAFVGVEGKSELFKFWRRRLLATARAGVADSERLASFRRDVENTEYGFEIAARRLYDASRAGRTPAPVWNMPDVSGFPTDGSERDA